MSSVEQRLHDIADVFCEVYDALSDTVMRHRAEEFMTAVDLAQLSNAVASLAESGKLTADSVRERIVGHADADAARFACLRGLDRVFAHVNPLMSASPPARLQDFALDVAERQRLDSGAAGGALLLRLRERGRPVQLPASRRDAFRSVLRVSELTFGTVDYRQMAETAHFQRREIERGLVVACAPFVADPDELSFHIDDRPGGRFYRIHPRNLQSTVARIPEVIEAMEASGAQLGLIPELTLTPDLLEAWQVQLRRPRPGGSLQWILVGSGDLCDRPRPANAAILLDARTGARLGRQDKLNPFNFSSEELEHWSLCDRLGEEPIDEDLEPGDRLLILDAGGVRLAVLVCEDLGDVEDLAALVRDMGVSILLVPVFARPTKDRRWERNSADVHARATGSTIVVANSQVMETILRQSEGTALIVWPGDAIVLRADAPNLAAVARLMADGTAQAA
jgi:predicted amidohydrolase